MLKLPALCTVYGDTGSRPLGPTRIKCQFRSSPNQASDTKVISLTSPVMVCPVIQTNMFLNTIPLLCTISLYDITEIHLIYLVQ